MPHKNIPYTTPCRSKFEEIIKQKYEEKGFNVYRSFRLFGGTSGMPDFWVTKKKLSGGQLSPNLVTTKRIGYKRKPQITQETGFFVECKSRSSLKQLGYMFTIHQKRRFPFIAQLGYRIIMEVEGYPEKTSFTEWFEIISKKKYLTPRRITLTANDL